MNFTFSHFVFHRNILKELYKSYNVQFCCESLFSNKNNGFISIHVLSICKIWYVVYITKN